MFKNGRPVLAHMLVGKGIGVHPRQWRRVYVKRDQIPAGFLQVRHLVNIRIFERDNSARLQIPRTGRLHQAVGRELEKRLGGDALYRANAADYTGMVVDRRAMNSGASATLLLCHT